MKLITVHGIRRNNRWYEDIAVIEMVNKERIEIVPFDYGYFSSIRFLLPCQRKKIIEKFCQFYDENFNSSIVKPSVVAHSFGTDIVFEAMKKYENVKFDCIILCGSILNSKTDFTSYINQNQFRKLYNDHGTLDYFLLFSRLVSNRYGRAGKIGFKNIPKIHRKYIINRKNYKGHSDYFLPLHIEKNWIQELISSRNIGTYNSKILKNEIIERLYTKNFQVESDFQILEIGFFARIDIEGNYFGKYQIHARNIGTHSIDSYFFTTEADGMHDIERMNIKIYDSANDLLTYDNVDDFPHFKKIKVRLIDPVNKDEILDTRIYFAWYNTIDLKSGDTDHLNIHNILKVKIQLNFPNNLKSPKLFEIKDKEIINRLNPLTKRERDGTFTYTLDYLNEKNIDGLIFYFEGMDVSKLNKSKHLEFKPQNLSYSGIQKNMFVLDKAKLRDIPFIYKVECEIELSNAASEETLRQRLNMFNDGFYVIRNKTTNEIIAYIESLIWNDKDFETFDEISNFPMFYNIRGTSLYVIFLAVSMAYRKNGFSKDLFKEIERTAKHFHVNQISLVAKDDLVDYYKKQNFEVVKELPNFLISRNYKSVKMLKRI